MHHNAGAWVRFETLSSRVPQSAGLLFRTAQKSDGVLRSWILHTGGKDRNKNDEALIVARKLIEEYPITYYGLNLQEELNIKPSFLQSKESQLTIDTDEYKQQAWSNYKELLKLSLLDEATQELELLGFDETPIQQVSLIEF